jgi:hypothetical protein
MKAGPSDTTVEDAIEQTYEVPSYVQELFALERELRDMRLLPRDEVDEKDGLLRKE